MKKLILILLMTSLVFAGGEISFKKQKEKLRRLEDAQLEAIRSIPPERQKEDTVEDIEPESTGSTFEDDVLLLNPSKKKQQNMKSS